MGTLLSAAYCLLAVAVLLLTFSLALAAREALRAHRARRWRSAREEHELEVMTEAIAIDHLIDEIREIDRKLNHYRHNVHCHSCGRFAKQAVGYPEGVADCSTHGIGIRSDPWTGSIPIIVQPLDELAIEVPSPELTDFIVSITTVPDDLSSLLEEASARTP